MLRGTVGSYLAGGTNDAVAMREVDVFDARRVRTARGLAYELRADGEPALSWTLHPYHLGDDVRIRGLHDEPVLRVTATGDHEYVDAHFTVVDERDGDVVGHVRWTLRSLLRRHWGLLDPEGLDVAAAVASSRFRSVVRQRWLRFVPYRYALRDAGGTTVGDLRGSLHPTRAFSLDLSGDVHGAVDPRLAVGAAAIVDAFEFR